MKYNTPYKRKINRNFTLLQKFRLFLAMVFLIITNQSFAQSTKEYKTSTDTLVVYSDVPGLTPSDKYTIRVRSVATNNEWVDVFAHYTYNKAAELTPILNRDGKNRVNITQAYSNFTKAWSHAYGNIEMNNGQAVEVEIAAKNGFKIAGKDFFKAKVYPAQKASVATMVDGKIYFTITKPGQIYIDINGQMDDYHAAINPIGQPLHVLMLFANPVMKKPSLTSSRVRVIEPGTSKATINSISSATYDTLYFNAGVHDIGSGIKLYPGKTIVIPGDAILYGSFNNIGVSAGTYSTNGENINFCGYGTISGTKIPHYEYAYYYPNIVVDGDKPIVIENSLNCNLQGITLADNANHTLEINGANCTLKWVKTISWRVNGDGLGGYSVAEDCFIRSADDCSYMKADKRRCTFWKDSNAALFHMAVIPENTIQPLIFEDCDALYCRLPSPVSTNGAGFQQRGSGYPGQRKVNVIVRNFRFHDMRINMPVFGLESGEGSSYSGILFQNISIGGMAPGNMQRILGSSISPWNGGLIFDNITIGGTLVTNENYKTYFTTNEFVKDIWFRMPQYFSITKNANATHGSVAATPALTTYIENSIVTLTATAVPGYEFTGWSGDTIATSNPLLLRMNGNKTVTANFNTVGAKTLTITASENGTVVSNPLGASQTTNSTVTLTAKPAVGYKFTGWNGDIAGNNIVTTLKMDTDKSVSANFVKTNSFAINCGGDQYIAADGTVYAQTPNGSFNTTATIANTNDQFLYKSERAGKVFSYDLPVDNGEYTVTLKFAEIFWQAAGKRVFDCSIEGTAVLTNFDIFAEAGSRYKALDKTFNTIVADGVLNIGFTTALDNAKISAIKIANDTETSVGEFSLRNSITIYPNPATDKLFFNSTDKLISKIELVDLTGKIVYTSNVKLHIGSVDLTGIALGLCVVKVYTDESIYTSRIYIK